jgi:hypothetical protein
VCVWLASEVRPDRPLSLAREQDYDAIIRLVLDPQAAKGVRFVGLECSVQLADPILKL